MKNKKLKIVDIKFNCRKDDVYDFETPSHSYILGNGLISHNTQEMYSKTVMSGGCVVAGTKIQMADGSLKEVQDILENEEVKTLNGHSIVTHTWNPDTLEVGEPDCYEIEFEDGYKVQCSDKHKFLIMDGDTPKWVKAKDLVSGMDTVAV